MSPAGRPPSFIIIQCGRRPVNSDWRRVLDFDHKAGISFLRDGGCHAHPHGDAFADDIEKETAILKIKIRKKLKFWSAKSSGYENFASGLRSEKKTRPTFEFPPFLKIETPTEEERRRDFRKPGENSIVLRFAAREDSPADESVLSAMTQNLSPGGVKIAAGQTLPSDAVLKVELVLPELQKTVTLRGKVKWVNRVGEENQFELGLEFVSPPSEDLLSLLEYTYKE